jgi:redox-sensitive bicupin YhaK (pirin superfamily)
MAAVALARSRSPTSVVKPLRLPVWPVANGLALTALDLVGLKDAAAELEVKIGGRVAPMSLDAADADPFILLVHHRHRFSGWDPIRPLFRVLLPEGFPAHPHRGFETVTMTLDGGLTHRDSLGIKQRYGGGEVQWLTAGRGVLHEEMWWGDDDGRAELYQLWLNLPARDKMRAPSIELYEPPLVVEREGDGAEGGGVRVHVLGGEHGGVVSGEDALLGRALKMLRVEIAPGASWRLALPEGHNCIVYTRRGGVLAGGIPVPAHHLAYLPARAAAGCDGLLLTNDAAGSSPDRDADVLVLAGQPLREPMAGGGTWVMNSQAELDQADRDYAAGKFGIPWDHKVSDEEWATHVRATSPEVRS